METTKVYVVGRGYGENRIIVSAVFCDKDKAQEYAKITDGAIKEMSLSDDGEEMEGYAVFVSVSGDMLCINPTKEWRSPALPIVDFTEDKFTDGKWWTVFVEDEGKAVKLAKEAAHEYYAKLLEAW